MAGITENEAKKLENYLKKKFCSDKILVKLPNDKEKPAEVYVNSEFIGTLYKDIDNGEVSYDFNIAILDIDIN